MRFISLVSKIRYMVTVRRNITLSSPDSLIKFSACSLVSP